VPVIEMPYMFVVVIVALLLFFGMLLAQEIGRRMAERNARRLAPDAGASTSAIDAAVFALLGLLLAFTFSGAAARFDTRRQLVVEEANDIGTAYLRVDLLPPDRQPALREAFRKYVDSRIATYQKVPDMVAVNAELARSSALQADIWKQAVAGTGAPGVPTSAAILLMPALNAMFDITTTRTMATKMHPPLIIFGMLFALALAGALLAGYGIGGASHRPWLHMVLFAAVMAVAVYVILDLEYPRLGLIRVDDFDQAIIALRATMN
jgi:hypothetical protein